MNNDERLEIADAFLEAVKLERKIQPLRYLERDIETILVAAKDSQEDNSVARIEEGIAHATLNKRNLEKLESGKQTLLETLSKTLMKYQEIPFPTDEQQSIFTWHNDLLSLWNGMNLEGRNNLRSHEIRVRSLVANIDDLSSLINGDSALASGQWQKPLLVTLRKLLQLTRKLKNAHNDVDIEMGSDMDSSLDLRLAQVNDRVDEVQKCYSARHEEVEKVKETIANLKTKSPTPTIASECVMAVVANLMPTMEDFVKENMSKFDHAMDKHHKSHIQKIQAAVDLSQLDELVKELHVTSMQPDRSSNTAMEY